MALNQHCARLKAGLLSALIFFAPFYLAPIYFSPAVAQSQATQATQTPQTPQTPQSPQSSQSSQSPQTNQANQANPVNLVGLSTKAAQTAEALEAHTATAGRGLDIVVLTPDRDGIYAEFLQQFEASWNQFCALFSAPDCIPLQSLQVITVAEAEQRRGLGDRTTTLVMTLGVAAADFAVSADYPNPIYFALLPKPALARLHASSLATREQPYSAGFIGQPQWRHMKLAQVLMPNVRTVGSVFGPGDPLWNDELAQAAAAQNLQLLTTQIDNAQQLGRRLNQLLPKTDALLAIPDPVVFNSSTIANILLASYRYRVPVLGYSEAMVRAGAAAAVYSEIPHMANHSAQALQAYARNQTFPAPDFAPEYRVMVNRDVLRSLGLAVPGEESLHRALLLPGVPP